ncbi:MAG: hypothetical protein EBS50_11490, partial [Sphingomonadaceae bacterium]|nr:hypothetical protein [Sphingomonadaceae bacterium]
TKPMGWIDTRVQKCRALIGKRIEIPVHYDLWARGARFGVVTSVTKDAAHIRVRMDHPQVKRLVKLAGMDVDHIKVLEV